MEANGKAALVQSETNLSMQTIVSAAEDQISSELADEAVILDLKMGVYYGLDPVGARIWKFLQEEPKAVGEICDLLVAEYDVTPDRCASEVRLFLSELAAKGIVDVRDADSGR